LKIKSHNYVSKNIDPLYLLDLSMLRKDQDKFYHKRDYYREKTEEIKSFGFPGPLSKEKKEGKNLFDRFQIKFKPACVCMFHIIFQLNNQKLPEGYHPEK